MVSGLGLESQPKYATHASQVRELRDVEHLSFRKIAVRLSEKHGMAISAATCRAANAYANRDEFRQAALAGKKPPYGHGPGLTPEQVRQME